jgi:hypothetical protein
MMNNESIVKLNIYQQYYCSRNEKNNEFGGMVSKKAGTGAGSWNRFQEPYIL